MPIPPLQPGESLQVPIVFEKAKDTFYWDIYGMTEPCFRHMNGKPDRGPENNWAICPEDWAKLSEEPETLSITVSGNTSIIDTTALMEQFKETLVRTPSEGSPLYVKYIYYGTGGMASDSLWNL